MSTIDRYARLSALGRPVVTTGEAAATWSSSVATAARSLTRLADAGLVTKICHGVWQVGQDAPDPRCVLPVLTNPYPSYISGWSVLARSGMIEQIPRSVFAVSLDRARTVETTFDRYEIHHIHPDLYGGFAGASGLCSGTATPEKALFDTVYLFGARHGRVSLPEIELPEGFDMSLLQYWVERIPSSRLRSMTSANLARLLGAGALQASA